MKKYSIDSRTINPGEIFIAIKGERFNGHDFVDQAIKKGASEAIVSQYFSNNSDLSDQKITIVEDTTNYLGLLARNKVQKISPKIIAITGSVGKTCTKTALSTVLSFDFNVFTPKKNFNTLIGISLAILNEMSNDTEILILEMGTYSVGTIKNLCKYFPPSIAVVTNVEPVHLERMGTIEVIAKAKSELVSSLSQSGVAFLNFDNHHTRAMKKNNKGKTYYFGHSEKSDIMPDMVSYINKMKLLGSYREYLGMIAYGIGKLLGMKEDTIKRGILSIIPAKGRLNIIRGKNDSILIDDTYNASLSSTEEAIQVLDKFDLQHKVAFLGDMLELGTEEDSSHKKMVEKSLAVCEMVFFIGPRYEKASRGYDYSNKKIFVFNTSDDVIHYFDSTGIEFPLSANTVILFKGSQGMRVEKILRYFLHKSITAESQLVRQEISWNE